VVAASESEDPDRITDFSGKLKDYRAQTQFNLVYKLYSVQLELK